MGPALAEMAAKGQPIPWTPLLSVGIDSIDSQHRVLLAYINQLSATIARGQSAATLADVIAGLESYTRLHFRHEERLFALYHWAESEDHQQGHRHFEAQLRSFRERLDSGDSALARDVMRFLIAWLAEHILEDDMAYSAHLREHGVR
jgi:hemerythrin-like metal-binding protein